MNDGNTAPLSPVTEDEMSHVRQVFEKAANAIVQASDLAVKVAELSKVVDALKAEVENVRKQSQWLDEQLTRVRTERDEANAKLHSQSFELTEAHAKANDMVRIHENDTRTIETMRSEINTLRMDRDNASYAHLEASEALTKANAKLDKLKEALGIVDPVPTKVDPQPISQGEQPWWEKERSQG